MKRKLILYIFLFLYTTLMANELELSSNNEILKIKGSFEIENLKFIRFLNEEYVKLIISNGGVCGEIGEPELPIYSKLVTLPETGNYVLKSLKYDVDEITLNNKIVPVGWEDNKLPKNNYYNKNEWFPKKIVTIEKPCIMRGYRFTQISLAAVQYNPALNKLRILKDIDVEFEIDYSKSENPLKNRRKIPSHSFFKIAKKNIYGIEQIKSNEEGSYLFIAPDNCVNTLQPLLRWKEKLGYKTKLATISETGSTNDSIRNYLQNAYDNWNFPPEYVVLVGDVTGDIIVPAFFVLGLYSLWDVTDHPYTLLDGNDYFPDIMIGRISVQSQMNLMTVINKIINYESDPYPGEWFKKALMIGVYDYYFCSPRETKMAIREKLLDYDYTEVDTFIHPYQASQTQLANMINQGYSLINYRGCGNYNLWSSQSGDNIFTINDVKNLNNGFMLPLITSITCGGGNFASEAYTLCFGETWLVAGSQSVPKGAIGFIGPSELNTQTAWNNCYDMGIYQGITQENLFRCGEMLLRGKMELYNNYPHCHSWGGPEDSDQFYFYVYNLLGDPGLAIWTDIPKEIELSFNNEILQGMNYLVVEVITDEPDKSDFTIAITDEDSLITTGVTDESGKANIPINLPIGNYSVTASKYGFIPKTDTLTVIDGNIISVFDYSFLEDITSGELVKLEVILKNLGNSTATNVQIELLPDDNYIQVIADSASVDSISADDTHSCEFQFQIGEEWRYGYETELLLNVNSNFGEEDFLIPIEIGSPELVLSEFIIDNSDSCLIQNEISDVCIELMNCGNVDSGNFSVSLFSLNDKTEILSSNSPYSNIIIDGTGINEIPFQIAVADVISGELAQYKLEILDDDTLLQNFTFTIPIGLIDDYSPTFCEYSYYAFESNDVGTFTPPIYNWIEIDPQYGGDGNLITGGHTTSDGYTKIINLPFQFQYFGSYYHKVSVCSNGWLAMGETDLVFHRNRTIPSGVGPKAMIAPFWDDLIDGNMYAYYDEYKHYFVIEWSEWRNVYNPDSLETFEMILYNPEYYPTPSRDGEILFQYKEIHNIDQAENYATVGIENESQTQGLLLSYANIYSPTVHPLQNETAILFTTRENPSIPYLTVEPASIIITLPLETSITESIILLNNGEIGSILNYSITLSHFSRGRNIPDKNSIYYQNLGKSIENDFIHCVTNVYIPIMPMDFLFYLYHNSPDNEPVYGVKIDFPPGLFVNSAHDIGSLSYNNETGDGVEISWGFDNGVVLSETGTQGFIVNVTIDESHTEPIELDWFIQGDGTGAEPHTQNGTITIDPTSDSYLWITYPNGGEKMVYGLLDSVKWLHYGNVEKVNIELSHDDGENWEMVAQEVDNTGVYEFIVPGPLSDYCKIKISALDHDSYDISNDVFQITALNIEYPNNGVIMAYNTQDTIKWIDCGSIDKVNIELSRDNGFTWEMLATEVDNTGLYEFSVTGPPSEECKIKISSLDDQIFNISSGLFSIVDSPIYWIIPNTTTGSITGEQTQEITVTFSSEGLQIGTYEAFIKITTHIGQIVDIPVTLNVIESDVNYKPELFQNYPNPFSTSTIISFSLCHRDPEDTEIKIYNIKGQLVRILECGSANWADTRTRCIGIYSIYWDGKDEKDDPVSSGLYFYQLKIEDEIIDTKKCLLLK